MDQGIIASTTRLVLRHNIEEIVRICDQLLESSSPYRATSGENMKRRILAEHAHYDRCREMVKTVADMFALERAFRY